MPPDVATILIGLAVVFVLGALAGLLIATALR